MLTAEIKEMPVNERIGLIEEIWESLKFDENEIDSPKWHKEILAERTALIESGKAKFLSLQDLRNFGE